VDTPIQLAAQLQRIPRALLLEQPTLQPGLRARPSIRPVIRPPFLPVQDSQLPFLLLDLPAVTGTLLLLDDLKASRLRRA
jgi:hypothetical protein